MRTACIFVMIHCLSVICHAANAGDVVYCSYAFGKKYEVTLSKDAVERTPVWRDDAENPPLSARKAIKLADALRTKLVQDGKKYKWKRKSAAIQFLPASNQCVWEVDYEPEFQIDFSGIPPELHLFVLMDGTVVQPVISDYR